VRGKNVRVDHQPIEQDYDGRICMHCSLQQDGSHVRPQMTLPVMADSF
jgi:hypothetical protein